MRPSAQPDDRPDNRPDDRGDGRADDRSSPVDGRDTIGDLLRGGRALDKTELDSALQLLVERAQYITGATGTALALPEGGEMVCRASAGSSAPAIGARLQVRSGLTAESIARRQLLRCNNAESDPRVNLEVCRALGIASIVVLPLLRRNGEVRGLFELFSDHPYAFEERDLIALERMADLTLTALDLAEQVPTETPNSAPTQRREPSKPAESLRESLPELPPELPPESPSENLPQSLLESLRELSVASGAGSNELSSRSAIDSVSEQRDSATSAHAESAPAVVERAIELSEVSPSADEPEEDAAVPEAMLRVQKCESCGFPVSEGRTLCLDCEKKDAERKPRESRQEDRESESTFTSSSSLTPEEFVPAFLANSASQHGSWLSNHINLLAIVVLILGILVAVVVFR
jgi:putative methionine-R-sulfoxide reductase with GAF domain